MVSPDTLLPSLRCQAAPALRHAETGCPLQVLSLTYADFTKAGLRLLCAQDGLQMTLKTTKPELVKKLKEQDAAKEGVVTSA